MFATYQDVGLLLLHSPINNGRFNYYLFLFISFSLVVSFSTTRLGLLYDMFYLKYKFGR